MHYSQRVLIVLLLSLHVSSFVFWFTTAKTFSAYMEWRNASWSCWSCWTCAIAYNGGKPNPELRRHLAATVVTLTLM